MSAFQIINPEQVLRMPGRPSVTYELDRPPYTRYRWDGTQMVELGAVSGAGNSVSGSTTAFVAATGLLAERIGREIAPDAGVVDTVGFTATTILRCNRGALLSLRVISGTGLTVQLIDGNGSGSDNARAIGTFAGLAAGDSLTLPRNGLEFLVGLTAVLTGTGTLEAKVI